MAEAVVTFDYEATQDDELTLKEGQVIGNINMMEDGWWEGDLNGKRGLFPDNFVELIKKSEKQSAVRGKAPSPPPTQAAPHSPAAPPAQAAPVPEAVNGDSQEVIRREGTERRKQIRAKVVFSYSPVNDDEIGLQVDDIVSITSQPEDGWWEGVLKGKKGMFPSNFVAVVERDEAGDSADVGDVADVKDEPQQETKPKPPKVKGVGFGNIFASGEVKLRKTPGNSASDHPKKESSAGQSELAHKRLSLKRAVPTPTAKSFNHAEAKARVEPKKDIKPEVKKEVKREEKKDPKKEDEEEYEEIIKERAKVIFPYEAQHSDELELKDGDIVTIIDKDAADSGWWLGEISGRRGVFPDNFVAMLPPEKEKIKKKVPVTIPARPTSVVPRPPQTETKQPTSRPSLDSPVPPKPSQPPPSSNQDTPTREDTTNRRPSHPTTQPRDDTNRKPMYPQAAPKPPKKVLPIPAKKPPVKSKPPPSKPYGPPPEREETQSAVILRRRPQVEDSKEGAEAGFDELKAESPPKLTHITLSRPKNANRRPPSVFGGQGGNLSDALPVENGTAVPPPRPKSSPIGPSAATVSAQMQSSSVTATKGHTEAGAAPSPVTSRPASLGTDTNQAQVEDLKKDIKTLQDQMVSIKSDLKKEVVKLMTELDEEKKHRMAMQVELDRIKKLVLEKD